MYRFVVPLFFMLLLPLSAQAVEPDEMLADPVLEERARVISKDLRCVVCQNQDIDSSNAGVARDLRLLVRERLLEGDSNNQVTAYIQARYGDYVLLKPPFKPSTYALWGTPIALTLIALLFGLNIVLRGRHKSALPELTEAEERQVAKFIDDEKSGDAS
ncbi:cytochrome c-type biogenesis protein CcmH [Sulfitobacter mediterraneus]|uniref:cytochrome c-type biogenesis protein n=1 Tax=Sulfitobacter mediterraneus TaxID=83219 RepID=UPI0019397440|nr:cytochrome c-type biogenesis protein [Sulfitobacter mediterraneus]MBM1558507.1 cytochrome c-type biogenesis protein CcmH [Sulfitobacter mediterraneus]MBM1569799.1 cytochrome c-type biogenesis protein CcmH [Sulfitobacter mediterraneus]MBM1573796.1 cytochrome c-type biogenesis protein CcmH [Sulfitobacter mediterraneus]MBM1577509.1 cytochrome c-type biogenesis protein CcmH [Sulfitobacter mediterraneus]MBM1581495.1 cytochrome c-type biogenesis protein CcmH [Sulfitobacter mediterraneus]